MTARPERWIIMLNRDATAEQTAALAEKIDALGKAEGFKSVDHFPGAILVQGNEAFAKKIKAQFGSDVRQVSRETFYKIPDTRPKIRKPPGL